MLVANGFIVLSCLQLSATVQSFLPGWVALKRNLETAFLVGTLVWMPPLNGLKALTFFAKRSILVVWQDSEYAYQTSFSN